MIKRRLNTSALFESIMRNISKDIRIAINEAKIFDGMDPDAAEKLRRTMNRYASYKSKGGSAKNAAKLVVDFTDVVDLIPNEKNRQKVLDIIASLGGTPANSTSNTANIPVNNARPVEEPTADINNEPEIPVNNVTDEPVAPSVDDDDDVSDEPEIPAYDDVDIDSTDESDTENYDNSDTSPEGIMETFIKIAGNLISPNNKKNLEYDKWRVEATATGARIIIVDKIQTKSKAEDGTIIDYTNYNGPYTEYAGKNLIDEECLKCDEILKPSIQKLVSLYTLKGISFEPESHDDGCKIDTIIYENDDMLTVDYGIDYDITY